MLRALLGPLLVLTLLSVASPAPVTAYDAAVTHVDAKSQGPKGTPAKKDPRRTRGLFVDTLMPGANKGAAYKRIGRTPQALWLGSDYYPTSSVQGITRAYVSRAVKAGKTPMLVVYSIPDRDCGQYSSGGLPSASAYRAWINKVAAGLKGSKPMLILEPDALPFYDGGTCGTAATRLGLLKYAVRRLAKAGAWVYIDAGHSNWTPYDKRAQLLKQAGIKWARGFSTNVSNFRTTGAEKRYANYLVAGLRRLGVTGKHYVIDTSRNGRKGGPADGSVINPTWARVGAYPRLVFKGAFDGTLWVKHPGESDGPENGGPSSGAWCNMLADRLLGRSQVSSGC